MPFFQNLIYFIHYKKSEKRRQKGDKRRQKGDKLPTKK